MERVPLDEALPVEADPILDFVALDNTLTMLEEQDARKGKAIELHYCAGLNLPEIAQTLAVSPSAIKGDLRFARAFLKARLQR